MAASGHHDAVTGDIEPRIAGFRQRIGGWEAQLKAMRDEAALQSTLSLVIGRLEDFAKRVRNRMCEVDWLMQRDLIRTLVKRVEINQDDINVVFRVDGTLPTTDPTSPGRNSFLQDCGRADDTALGNAFLAGRLQHDLQKMHNVRVINPLCHFLQQPVVPDVVEIGSQVEVQNARLPLDNRLSNPLDRTMSCSLGPISKRSRLEIRLEDRFEYELERTLCHPVPDRRYRKDADLAPVFRYLLPPGWEWLVSAPDQFVPQLLEQSPYALCLDGLEGNPVYSRRTVVLFGHLIRCTQGLHLADVDV